jgi:putative redox protein
MVQVDVRYTGDLHCSATHGPSGAEITTDAPTDNHGRGEAFSPTDLVGTAMATCILTIMAIAARRDGIDLAGTTCRVTKEMSPQPPRRIAKITCEFNLPVKPTLEQRLKLENAARTCPVHRALHGNVEVPLVFHWAE